MDEGGLAVRIAEGVGEIRFGEAQASDPFESITFWTVQNWLMINANRP